MKPLAIDLFCGLGGWTEGLLAEGWRVVGFDIERHQYGDMKYPAQMVLQDVLTIHGSQFKDARLIVASPPCQEYSYMAMPWSLAKQKQREYEDGTRDRKQLTALFDACFRIQREACEAAGRHIPMVVENVRGAQKWVGRAKWNFGSFYLWGDVPALMPIARKAVKVSGMDWSKYGTPGYKAVAFNDEAIRQTRASLQTASVQETGIKTPGRNLSKDSGRKFGSHNMGPAESIYAELGIKAGSAYRGKCSGWGVAQHTGSNSKARKAASAQIAKIPLVLSRHIASVYR